MRKLDVQLTEEDGQFHLSVDGHVMVLPMWDGNDEGELDFIVDVENASYEFLESLESDLKDNEDIYIRWYEGELLVLTDKEAEGEYRNRWDEKLLNQIGDPIEAETELDRIARFAIDRVYEYFDM